MTHVGVKIIWEQFCALQLITQEVLEVSFFVCLFFFCKDLSTESGAYWNIIAYCTISPRY